MVRNVPATAGGARAPLPPRPPTWLHASTGRPPPLQTSLRGLEPTPTSHTACPLLRPAPSQSSSESLPSRLSGDSGDRDSVAFAPHLLTDAGAVSGLQRPRGKLCGQFCMCLCADIVFISLGRYSGLERRRQGKCCFTFRSCCPASHGENFENSLRRIFRLFGCAPLRTFRAAALGPAPCTLSPTDGQCGTAASKRRSLETPQALMPFTALGATTVLPATSAYIPYTRNV